MQSIHKTAGILLVGVAGSLVSIVMPAVVQGLVQAGIATPSQAAMIAAVEMIGTTVSLVLVAPFMASVNRRLFALSAILLAIAGHGASMFSTSFHQLLVTRSLAGLGEGAMVASMAGAIAASNTAERLFAIYVTCNMLVSLVFFRSVELIQAHGGVHTMYLILAAASVVALIAVPAFPVRFSAGAAHGAAHESAHGTAHGSAATPVAPSKLILRAHVLLALGGTLVFFSGVGLVWPLMAEIGASSYRLSSSQIADALGLSVILGAIAGIGTSWLGMRAGRRIPLSLGTIGVAATTAVLAVYDNTYNSTAVFAPAVGVFMIAWVVSTAFYMGCIAAFDPAGRLSALGVAMQSSGLFIGAAVASTLIAAGGYSRVLYLGVALCIGALVAMIAADSLFRRGVSQATRATIA